MKSAQQNSQPDTLADLPAARAMHQLLLEWYWREKRDLPFRRTKNPYCIWVSEIMAQQTRIEAMLGHYERFMENWPDVHALSQADDEKLMKAWEGLGYYSRARNLKKAACVVVREYEGQLPCEKKELMKLPGIGDYTAGAIASIAFGKRESAVDGNVIRVYSRWKRFSHDTSDPKIRKQIIRLVEAELPEAEKCGDWNQALMELGASVCTPRNPSCLMCPVNSLCASAFCDDAEQFPYKKPKAARKEEDRLCIIYAARHEGRWYVHTRRRPSTGLLAGLYEFDWKEDHNRKALRKLSLKHHDHVFTHKIWHIEGWLVETNWDETMISWQEAMETLAYPSALKPLIERAGKGLNSEWINR